MSERNSTSLLSEFIDGFAWENRDKRLDGLPLADSVLPTVYICMVYIFLARVAAPKYMENRPAVSTNVVYIYNGMMIVADFTIFAKVLHYNKELGFSWGKKSKLVCPRCQVHFILFQHASHSIVRQIMSRLLTKWFSSVIASIFTNFLNSWQQSSSSCGRSRTR